MRFKKKPKKTKGLRFLGFGFLGSVYEAHRRSKTEALKLNPYKIYDT